MIRYNKTIYIKKTKYGNRLETDRGEVYEMMAITAISNSTPITTWWDKQSQSKLRRDQLDCIVKEYWRQNNALDLFVVYKKGEGYSQSHDILLAFDPIQNIWILSTEQHTWFELDSVNGVSFKTSDALGSLENMDTRLEIYEVIDKIGMK